MPSDVTTRGHRGRRAALAAGAVGSAILIFYLWLIVVQGVASVGRVTVSAGTFAVASSLAFLSTRAEPLSRLLMLAGSSGIFVVLGLMSLLSIRMLLLVSGVLSSVAFVGAWRDATPIRAGGVAEVVAALLAGPRLFFAGAAVT